MIITVRKTYACPACGESFTKWGLCLSHVKSSAPCREVLGDKLRNTDLLQELCKAAAGGGGSALQPPVPVEAAPASVPEPAPAPVAAPAPKPAPSPPAPAVSAVPPAAVMPVLQGDWFNKDTPTTDSGETVVTKRFTKAVHTGYLTKDDLAKVQSCFKDLTCLPAAVQLAAVDKFFSIRMGQLRAVADKSAWLLRCIAYSRRTDIAERDSNSPSTSLVEALAVHALLPEALSQECWDAYADLGPELQPVVVHAVRASILANISGSQRELSEHFLNLVHNEKAVYRLEALPLPRVEQQPQQVTWEEIDGSMLFNICQTIFFKQKKVLEQQLLQDLTRISEQVAPGEAGSLLHLHLATKEARSRHSAEVLSILHAAAGRGLVRVCARFLAEGLDVNERAGDKDLTALHVASSCGEVEVVKLLLRQRAEPNLRDGDGHSALHVAVLRAKAAQLENGCEGGVPTTHASLQLKVCLALLMAGAETAPESNFADDEEPQTAESIAETNELSEIRNSIRLHRRLRTVRQKFGVTEAAVNELCQLQYETAMFLVVLLERHSGLSPEAAPTEFQALITSDFIKARDHVQRLGNRLARALHLSKKAVDALVDLPPAAGLHALNTWKVEELVDDVYTVPEHLNAPPPPPEGGSAPDQKEDEAAKAAAAAAAAGRWAANEPKRTGRVRKWDSERGFGFVVQDPRGTEEAGKDIFVHRKNIVGSTPQNHLDLRENCKISYRLGEQDGRPRALEATMIDVEGNPLPVHFAGSEPPDIGEQDAGLDNLDNDDDCDEERLTRMFMKHLRSREVKEVVNEKRPECDAWFRCVGLRRHGTGRRDDSMWKKEIEKRVDIFLEKQSTPLQKRDFDFRVRRFLHEFCVHSGTVVRVSEALAMVETSTAGKRRDEVQNWPAYLATLLRRFDPKLYEVLADRDRRSRVEQRKAREAPSSVGDATLDSALGENASTLGETMEGSVLEGGMRDEEEGESSSRSSSPRAGTRSASAESRQSGSCSESSDFGGGEHRSSSPESGDEGALPYPARNCGPPPPPPTTPPPPPPEGQGSLFAAKTAAPGARATPPGLFAAALRAAGNNAPGAAAAPAQRRSFQ